MSKNEDTEITLGTGKMLGLFFGLVILCAVFFGMGFSMDCVPADGCCSSRLEKSLINHLSIAAFIVSARGLFLPIAWAT